MGEIFRQRIIFSYSIVDAADLTWKLMGFAKDQPMPKCVLFLVPGCGGSAVKHIGPEYDGCLIEVSMMEHGHGCPNLAKCLKNINIPFRIRWTGTAKKYPFHFQIYKQSLGGGFKYLLFSPLFGEDSQFDSYFSKGVKTTNQINPGWQKEKKNTPHQIISPASCTASGTGGKLRHQQVTPISSNGCSRKSGPGFKRTP